MTYLKANKRRFSPWSKMVAIIIAAAIVLVAGIMHFAPSLFPSLWMSVAAPFWRAELSIESGSLRSNSYLLAENEALKMQLADMQARMDTVQSVESENDDLRALLGGASTTPLLLSAVLAKPPLSPYDVLIIDYGRDRDFSSSSMVYAAGEIPLGRVSEAGAKTSKVSLFSSPGEKNEVLIGPAHVSAVAVGRGGGQYEADIPRDAKVAKGDFVIAPFLGGRQLAVVADIISDPADPFEKVLFAPPVNIYQLRWVLVDVKGRH